MDPYIEFFSLCVNLVVTVYKGAPLLISMLVATPFVAVCLFIGWRKGFVGLKGSAIGIGVLGIAGVFIYLSGQPPSPGARGSFQWPDLEADGRCDSDSDCGLGRMVKSSCCPGCPSKKFAHSKQRYNERLEQKMRICEGFDSRQCPVHKCRPPGKSKSQMRAKCVDHQCTLVETPWNKAGKGGKRRTGKRKAGNQHPARAKRGKRP